MTAHNDVQPDPHEKRHLSAPGLSGALLAGGVVVLLVCFLLTWLLAAQGTRRFWLAYVQNYAFLLSLSLGALFFVLLQHLTRSGWSVVVRRPAEIIALNVLLLAVLFVPIAGVIASGTGVLYPWARPASAFEIEGHDEAPAATQGGHDDRAAGHIVGHEAQLILEKRPYLNSPFFVARWIIYFAVWAGLAWWFWKRSVRQDASGDADLTTSMEKLSGPAMLIFALTATLASFDLLMSLDPIWFSTIFGVYFFSGSTIGFFALLIILLVGLQKRGLLTSSVNVEHYHDLGKFLFGFVFFWGYIAFSQYMLIWYGNIPEETGWFFRRGCATHEPNVWSVVIVLLLVFHFLVPFVALLSRDMKRRTQLLTFWAVWMLVWHWVDLYWLVMPELTTAYLPLVTEIGVLLGMAAVFAAGLIWWAGDRSLLPVGDPRLAESLAFRNL